MMWRLFTTSSSYHYLDKINDIVNGSYNQTFHRVVLWSKISHKPLIKMHTTQELWQAALRDPVLAPLMQRVFPSDKLLVIKTYPTGLKLSNCLDYNMNKTDWSANHVKNWVGLVFLAETCFSWLDREVGASSLVLSFSIVLSLYKRDTIQLVGWNRITRHKQSYTSKHDKTIMYSKACIHLHLINTLLYCPVKLHHTKTFSTSLNPLVKPVWVPLNLFACMNKIGLVIPSLLFALFHSLKSIVTFNERVY